MDFIYDENPIELADLVCMEEKISFDFEENHWSYTAVLNLKGKGYFEGDWTARKPGELPVDGKVTGNLVADDYRKVIFGIWYEDDSEYNWFLELPLE